MRSVREDIRRSRPRRTSSAFASNSNHSVSPTTGIARSTRPIRATTGGRSGYSSSSSSEVLPTRRNCPSGGAPSSARPWRTRKSSTESRKSAVLNAFAVHCANGCCVSPSMPTSCSQGSTMSTGPTARRKCNATGLGVAKAQKSISRSSVTTRSRYACSRHDPIRCSERRIWCSLPSTRSSSRSRHPSSEMPSTSTAKRLHARVSSSAPSCRRRRPAYSRAPMPSTPLTMRTFQSGLPITCSQVMAPARSWLCRARTNATGISPQPSICPSSERYSHPRTSTARPT